MTHDQQIEKIKNQFSDIIVQVEKDNVGCPIIWIKHECVIEVLKYLKETEDFEFLFLADLTAYDDYGTDDEERGRFVLVYNLYSPQYRLRFRVKARIPEDVEALSCISLWDAANWAEREVYDMFGIRFKGHPDLRRILMDIRWEGYPLRKDYYWRKYQLFNDPEPIPEHLLKEE